MRELNLESILETDLSFSSPASTATLSCIKMVKTYLTTIPSTVFSINANAEAESP